MVRGFIGISACLAAASFVVAPTAAGSHGGSEHCPGYASDPRNQVVVTGTGTFTGTTGEDIMCSLGPGATLDGGDGNDLLLGDAGNDTYYGGPDNDVIEMSDGVDYGTNAWGGTGDDEIRGGIDAGASIHGDEGDDTLYASTEAAGNPLHSISTELYGDSGEDQLVGAPSTDGYRGNGPDARMYGGPGIEPDTFVGTSGGEWVLYVEGLYGQPGPIEYRTEDLHIDQDGQADDGAVGEGDMVGELIEGIDGGSGDDVIVGNDSHNFFFGHAGDDVLSTSSGGDLAYGGEDADIVNVQDFGPIVPFAEVQLAADALRNPPPTDPFVDVDLPALAISDGYGCGGTTSSYTDVEFDSALVDPGDQVGELRSGPPPGGCDEVTESSIEIKVDADGNAIMPLACEGSGKKACEGSVRILAPPTEGSAAASAKRRPRVVARAKYRIRRGKQRRVRLELRRGYLRKLRRQEGKRRRARVVLKWLYKGKRGHESHPALIRKPRSG